MPALPAHRRAFGSGLADYAFEPCTLLFHIPGPASRLKEGPSFGTEFFNHYLSLVHESVHWLQFHGTTFGAFVQLIASSQAQNALGRLANMSGRKRRALLERRIRKRERIVSGSLRDSTGDAEIDDLRENWLEHESTYRLMIDGVDSSFRTDPASSASFVAGLCCIGASALAGTQSYPGDAWARKVFLPAEPNIFRSPTNDGLTFRSLIEGAATAQEYLAISELEGLKTLREEKRQAMQRKLRATLTSARSAYGRAFRYFSSTLHKSMEECLQTKMLHLFICLVDLAMNPVVPPANIPEDYRTSWEQVYPPVRFQRLLSAVMRSGTVTKKLAPHNIGPMTQSLLCRSGLPPIPETVGPDFGGMSYQDFQAGFGNNSVLMEHQRFRYWVQARMRNLRKRYAWAFTGLHAVILGGTRRQRWRYRRNEENYGWFLPPFRWAFKGEKEAKVGFLGIDQEHGTEILLSAATQNAQFNLFRRTGPLELPQYPHGDRDYIRSCIRASYDHRFGCPFFQEW